MSYPHVILDARERLARQLLEAQRTLAVVRATAESDDQPELCAAERALNDAAMHFNAIYPDVEMPPV